MTMRCSETIEEATTANIFAVVVSLMKTETLWIRTVTSLIVSTEFISIKMSKNVSGILIVQKGSFKTVKVGKAL